MDDTYFVIPLWADLTAVAVGGIQGALFASGFQGKRRVDLLGVTIIGVVMGMGGGIIRDLLVNVTPATMLSNWYLVTATSASLIGMLLAGVFQRLNRAIVVLDAVSIGMFGALGATKALGVGMPLIPSIFVGVSAAVGGGMLRDVLMGLPVAVMHVGSLYAVAAGAGCTVLAVAQALGAPVLWAGVVCVVVTAVIRVLAVVFDLSLPEQRRLYRRRVAAERRAQTG
ncbi:trimeric intracellular cation channel family protein [Micropruina sonneratiae]|uniref:trimeric intracellular cation channel family protein n=1 Tax=Micropruina sonneratiae TaxID=2986940 RepID=UPI0022261B8D|nr:TRIC cation channel family protein [Micropruina sp. KQZ13P-5]MCW3159220.1 TRIC cation channel family protein [Micropruina sp. KQZ13P-5]